MQELDRLHFAKHTERFAEDLTMLSDSLWLTLKK